MRLLCFSTLSDDAQRSRALSILLKPQPLGVKHRNVRLGLNSTNKLFIRSPVKAVHQVTDGIRLAEESLTGSGARAGFTPPLGGEGGVFSSPKQLFKQAGEVTCSVNHKQIRGICKRLERCTPGWIGHAHLCEVAALRPARHAGVIADPRGGSAQQG